LAKLILIERYKKAPDGQYFDWTGNIGYEDVPTDSETTASTKLSLMEQRDVLIPNHQGSAGLLSTHLMQPMTSDDSGWLYIRQLVFDSGVIFDVHVTVTVDVAEYLDWYNSVKPLNSDGTCSAQWCWDADGNPVRAIGVSG